MLPLALFVSFALVTAVARSGTGRFTTDPTKVQIITSDIGNFWRAYDDARKTGNLEKALAYEYLAPGSAGVWGFVPQRIVSPTHLARVVAERRSYYEAARPYMRRIAGEKWQIMRDFYRCRRLYPEAIFPDVYFVVGALNSGGTSVDRVGMVIGAEMVSRPDVLPAMPGFETAVLSRTAAIPGLVMHEFTHFNQHDADANTLLDGTIVEGSADFMAELVEPSHVPEAQWSFACAHEDALWRAFQQQMDSTDDAVVKPWLFSYDSGPLGAPPFIGYWLGSRIVQTYYVTHDESHAALHAIMNISNFKRFLSDSGYPASRPACSPPTA